MGISEVSFGSLLTYTPRGNLTEHFRSRSVMRNLKNDEVLGSGNLMSTAIAQTLRNNLQNYPFSDYFNEKTMLVPTPKNSLPQRDELWVPQRITSALENQGLGINEECLTRVIPLPRSSTSLASNRPKTIQHYDSLQVRESLLEPKEIVLVDDVITRGATVMGAVNILLEAFPKALIRVFVAMRTTSDPDKFSKIIDPCVGTISLVGEDTFREP